VNSTGIVLMYLSRFKLGGILLRSLDQVKIAKLFIHAVNTVVGINVQGRSSMHRQRLSQQSHYG